MSTESRKRMAENCISPDDEVYLAPNDVEPDDNGNYTITVNGITYTSAHPIGAIVHKPWGDTEVYSQGDTNMIWQDLYGEPAYRPSK